MPNLGRNKIQFAVIATVVVLGHHNEGDLNNRHLFLTVLKAGSPRSGCQHGLVLVRTLFLACRRPLSCCVLTWQREKEIFLFL